MAPTKRATIAFYDRVTLKAAVDTWCGTNSTAQAMVVDQYGPIESWDVSGVTDMSSLFANKNKCNPPIGSWTTAKVKRCSGLPARSTRTSATGTRTT